MKGLEVARAILAKDLLLDLRTRDRLGHMAVFALLVVASLSIVVPASRPERLAWSPALLWVVMLFTSLLEAGFAPDNNWEEAVNSEESAVDLATLATNGNRERLASAFNEFAGLPEDVRLRRLAYLAEATAGSS